MILKLRLFRSPRPLGGIARPRRRRRPMKPDSAAPQCGPLQAALRSAGGAGAAGGRAARGAAADFKFGRSSHFGRSTAAPKAAALLRASRRAWLTAERGQTRMLRKVAALGAGGAGAAGCRVVSGAAAEADGRSKAAAPLGVSRRACCGASRPGESRMGI